MTHGILLIEDEEVFAGNVKRYLERRGYEVVTAGTATDGLKRFEEGEFDLVLLDLNLPDIHGLKVLEEIRSSAPRVRVICVTGAGSIQVAVDAMKAGAYDYVTKPVALSELKIVVDKAVGQDRIEGALSYYTSRNAGENGVHALLGTSPAISNLRKQIQSVIAAERNLIEGSPPAVLVRGETGTGKELVARAFHFDGLRRDAPFIEINCSALPEQLLESELFGYERGAFTDAKERKMGLVEAGHGGTLFMDEIGDTQLAVQAKLLKLLEDRTVRRVGGLRDRLVDVRFISATNRPLEDLVQAGQFRADLYYRLRVVTIDIPPLRARSGDAEMLARHFLALHARRYGRSGVQFTAAALDRIRTHDWPGNVRELRNVVEQALLCARGDWIEETCLAIGPSIKGPAIKEDPTAGQGEYGALPLKGRSGTRGDDPTLEEAERTLIDQALSRSGGNISQAAKCLGISRDTLRYRLAKYRNV